MHVPVNNLTFTSAFFYFYDILRKYRLPELYNILQDIPTKANWKKEIKDKIQEYWEKQWIEEAKKRTPNYCNVKIL
jgi:hypothetical protein